MTWAELRAALGPPAAEARDWIVVERLGRRLIFLRAQVDGEDWLVAEAAVCPEGRLSGALALAHNATLAVGALCTQDGALVLRHTGALASLRALPRIVELLAHEAARLAALVETKVTPAAQWQMYAD